MSQKNTSLKKFIGEKAYNIVKNIYVDNEAIRKALVTPQNARNVFSELSEYQIKSLCSEICASGTIGTVRATTKEEIINAFNSVGYNTIIFDDYQSILDCKKYYADGERICTYNDLKSRMNEYHMIVAIKNNIDDIKRANIPQRDDEYGTSILNIQIAKNGSHMSIKNRYNHTVSQPDSTLNNNLDVLCFGLQSMVLGYYDLASLSKNKSYYDNIVNIGGVYLKYFTERNNVYFGDFALDSTNGVRYADKSRYRIIQLDNEYRWDRCCIVLDFHEKVAIDMSNKKEPDGRVVMLSNLIKNNVLINNHNIYEDAFNTSHYFTNAKQMLLQTRKKSLQCIHDIYGYDFTKPFNVTAILGKFTAKSIEKLTGSNNGILIVNTDEAYLVELNNGKFNAKDLKVDYGYNINTFYTQGDFEKVRKSGNSAIYIIQQESQYIGKSKEKSRTVGRCFRNPEIIDKSGYNVSEVRENLQYRLRQYKANKRALEASQVDYTKDEQEINSLFNNFKNSVITVLTAADTSEEYRCFTNILNYSFVLLVQDIEDFKSHVKNNDFKSVESARSMIDGIKNKLNKLKEKLSGKKADETES